jgi:hypothetical protein
MNKLRNRDHRLAVVLLLLAVLGCNHAACERSTTVAIYESKNPPTFSLSGNGYLNFFWVSEVDAQTMKRSDRTLWEVWPTHIQSTAIPDLPHITYGRVPAGFTQKVPARGAPAPLLEGKIYEAGGPSSGAAMNVFRFTIKDGKAVEVSP